MAMMRSDDIKRMWELQAAKQRLCEQLKIIFEEMDSDGSGSLTMTEICQGLADDSVQCHLDLAGYSLRVADIEELHDILDNDNDNSVTIDEFIEGLVKIKGEATRLDVLRLEYAMKSQRERDEQWQEERKREVGELGQAVRELRGEVAALQHGQDELLRLLRAGAAKSPSEPASPKPAFSSRRS